MDHDLSRRCSDRVGTSVVALSVACCARSCCCKRSISTACGGIASASILFGDQLGLMFAAGVIMILGGLALAVANKRPAPEVTMLHEQADSKSGM